MSRGFRKSIREKKAAIRKTVLDPKEQEKTLQELQDSIKAEEK